MTAQEKFSQEEVSALQKEFGTGAVADYFKIADHVETRRVGVSGIVSDIEAGTKKKVGEIAETRQSIRKMHAEGKDHSEIALKLGIGVNEVYNCLNGK